MKFFSDKHSADLVVKLANERKKYTGDARNTLRHLVQECINHFTQPNDGTPCLVSTGGILVECEYTEDGNVYLHYYLSGGIDSEWDYQVIHDTNARLSEPKEEVEEVDPELIVGMIADEGV